MQIIGCSEPGAVLMLVGAHSLPRSMARRSAPEIEVLALECGCLLRFREVFRHSSYIVGNAIS
jgi:hypothetical protein